jgi:glycerophosphoryl diester phosphodiesterase
VRPLLLVALCACIPLDTKRVPKKNPDFLVVGHRGAPNQAPENTIPSLDAALALGARALEIDLCVTADGEVVLWHDRDPDDEVALARQNGLEGLAWRPFVPDSGSPLRRPVDQLALADFLASHGYARDGERDPAAEIPLFSEVVAWAAGQDDLLAIYLDLKIDDPAQVAPVLELAAGLDQTVYAMSVDRPIVEALIAAGAGVRPIWDHEEGGALADSEALGLRDLALGLTALRSESAVLEEIDEARRAREQGRIDSITVWTLSEPMQMAVFLFHEVDAILTDDPQRLHRIWQATL